MRIVCLLVAAELVLFLLILFIPYDPCVDMGVSKRNVWIPLSTSRACFGSIDLKPS